MNTTTYEAPKPLMSDEPSDRLSEAADDLSNTTIYEEEQPDYGEKPNVFIVGAPKSGTTSLHNYLLHHPHVWASIPKEPYYFIENHEDFTQADEYLKLWQDSNHPTRLEATPTYLRSPKACSKIHEFNQDAKIIILLREPTSLLHSLHNQFRLCVSEPIAEFKEALQAEKKRREQDTESSHLFYSSFVKFSKQIRIYHDTFGQENVHITFLDDLAQDAHATYQDILDFLHLPAHEPDYEVYNESRQIKYRRLHKYLFADNIFKRFAQQTLPYTIYETLSLKIFDFTTIKRKNQISKSLRQKIKSQLKPEVRRLGKLLNEDLINRWDYDSINACREGPLHVWW